MNEQTNIERIVMRRVRLMRLLLLVLSTGVLAALTLTAALWGIGKEVWVARVLQNDPDDLLKLPQFYTYAFLHTRFIVQALSVLTLVSLGFLAREVIRILGLLFSANRREA